MTEKIQLEQQLWNIANALRGKMGADDSSKFSNQGSDK